MYYILIWAKQAWKSFEAPLIIQNQCRGISRQIVFNIIKSSGTWTSLHWPFSLLLLQKKLENSCTVTTVFLQNKKTVTLWSIVSGTIKIKNKKNEGTLNFKRFGFYSLFGLQPVYSAGGHHLITVLFFVLVSRATSQMLKIYAPFVYDSNIPYCRGAMDSNKFLSSFFLLNADNREREFHKIVHFIAEIMHLIDMHTSTVENEHCNKILIMFLTVFENRVIFSSRKCAIQRNERKLIPKSFSSSQSRCKIDIKVMCHMYLCHHISSVSI